MKPTEESTGRIEPVVMPDPDAEFIEIPITDHFRRDAPPIGVMKILKSALPKNPDWVLSLGYKIAAQVVDKDHPPQEYELMEMSIVSDWEYKGYLNQEA